MKNKTILDNLTDKNHIAFGFNYHGGTPDEIMVAQISFVHNDSFIVHFLYGHHSLGETVKKTEVLAVGDSENGTIGIKGWSGKYKVLQPDNELLKQNLK